MKVIKFKVEGVFNSFRIPFFKTYHKTFLSPPKTTIAGLLANISNKPQKEFFEMIDKIKVGVIIENIDSKFKDLWRCKIYKDIKEKEKRKKARGNGIIRRDKLFNAVYTIYVYNFDIENLKNPLAIPSLGLDDEMVRISNVEEIEFVNKTSKIHSSFLCDEVKIKDIKVLDDNFIMPIFCNVPIELIGFEKNKRIPKKVKKEKLQVDFFNCEVEVEGIEGYLDETTKKGVVLF